MYYLDHFANLLSLKDQLSGYSVVATEDYLGIKGDVFELQAYAWPDDRVCFKNLHTGESTVKRFGPAGADEMRRELEFLLNSVGVDLGALHM